MGVTTMLLDRLTGRGSNILCLTFFLLGCIAFAAATAITYLQSRGPGHGLL